jgi:hypothetical protein
MIQAPFNSSCAALQHETGTKFSIERFHTIKNCYFTICIKFYIQTNDNRFFEDF